MLENAADRTRLLQLSETGAGPSAAFGVPFGNQAHLIASFHAVHTVLVVTGTDLTAERYASLIRSYGAPADLFLTRETPLTYVEARSSTSAAGRIAALSNLALGKRSVVVASAPALMQRIAPKEAFASQIRTVKIGDVLPPQDLIRDLILAGYVREDLAEGPGQTAARGDIVDVFPPGEEFPVRIEFFGDEVDQIRLFDPETQRGTKQISEIRIPPVYEVPQTPERIREAAERIRNARGFDSVLFQWDQGTACAGGETLLPLLYPEAETLFDYLPEDPVIVLSEEIQIEEALRTEQARFHETVTGMLERGEGIPEQGELECSAKLVLDRLNRGRTILFNSIKRIGTAIPARRTVQIPVSQVPQYLGGLGELSADLKRWTGDRYAVLLYAGSQKAYLADFLSSEGIPYETAEHVSRLPEHGTVFLTGESVGEGLIWPTEKQVILSEQELCGRAERPKIRARRKKSTLVFSELNPGDYVVHETHGIGRFVRIETLTVEGKTKDYLLIEYKGGDRLYIPTEQLDRIDRYISGSDADLIVPLSRLGSREWRNKVSSAKTAAKKLAVDLAQLYAFRMSMKGFAFSPDSPMQKTFEEKFPFQDTADQAKACREIKEDMEQERPMDRLLCGDVGYGKTEVALRAAFKAILDSKQAAILAPTTILAKQHFETAKARFEGFPVSVGCISRFSTEREKSDTLRKLKDGKLDLIIGTHALLGKRVEFHDLGLLIIDEEHRFGVNDKEKIKALKKTVDVLTLTATPIPRTLNMSMTGVRDISTIETPPEGRLPVQTFVMEYTDALLVDAVSRELARNGQVYIVYNRVESIGRFAERLLSLMPALRVLIAHGQMNERDLDRTMTDFIDHEADVLLCSTIIESGLDIPNVNTIVVVDSDRMGLAQLYQLRGRIGRSTRIGYAYFTVPSGKELNEKAAKRMSAIREFAQFGAGFRLAMRDLEIRGAGSLLGAEQHGHIADIGYEYYTRLVRSALDSAVGRESEPEIEPVLNVPLNAHIPHSYIGNELQRLRTYRRISEIRTQEDQLDATEELIDRYGDPPEPVLNLMLLARIRAGAAQAGICRVNVAEGHAELAFDASAVIDGARLIAAVSGYQGMKLLATDPPGIRIDLPGQTAERIAMILPQLFSTIADCSDRRPGV